nr:hypothetical protein CFP56_05698 [Quercus suber]
MEILCHMDAIPECPKLSHEDRGGANVPSKALNPLPLRVTNEASTTNFVISNKCIGIKFEPTQRRFDPFTSGSSFRHVRRWNGCKKVYSRALAIQSFSRNSLQDVKDVGREIKGRVKVPIAIAINHVADQLMLFTQIQRPV